MAEPEARYTEAQSRALAEQFEPVRQRARGLAAAPASWLPAAIDDLGSALRTSLGRNPDRQLLLRTKEAMIDLQAFGPDAAAHAAQRVHAGAPQNDADRQLGEQALEEILRAQARAICGMRGDDRVLGAINALRPLGGVVIGDAERALAAVDRYKEGQAAGFMSMLAGPVVIGIAAIIGGILFGVTSLGVALAAVSAIGYFFGGAVVGQVLGRIQSRARRWASRIADDGRSTRAVALVEAGQIVALIAIPVLTGLVAMAIGAAAAQR